jgi:hypothetical protein
MRYCPERVTLVSAVLTHGNYESVKKFERQLNDCLSDNLRVGPIVLRTAPEKIVSIPYFDRAIPFFQDTDIVLK